MRFKVGFYEDSNPANIRYEFVEAPTFFKAVSMACTMKEVGWSQYSVTEVFESSVNSSCDCWSCVGSKDSVCLTDSKCVKARFLSECG